MLEVASTSALRDLVQGQLGDVTSWDEFKRTPVELDVMAIVSEVERQHLDALPSGVRIHGDMVAFEYVMHGGVPMIRVHLKTGQVRRLQVADLPELDRPVLLTVRRGGASLEATTPDRLRQVLEEYQPPREERDRGGRRRDRDPKGPGRGGRGDRGGKGGSRGKGGPGGGRRRR